MYTILALALTLAFTSISLLMPFRLKRLEKKILKRLERTLLATARHGEFNTDGRRTRLFRIGFRVWLATGVASFALLGILDGHLAENRPGSLGVVIAYAGVALGGSALVLMTLVAITWLIPGARSCAALCRAGIRSIHVAVPRQTNDRLRRDIAERIRTSGHFWVLDITGLDILGKGAGLDGGLLFNAIASAPSVPVSVLLHKPYSEEPDPDRRHATVFQTLLAEMQITAPEYIKRIRMTLRAVEELNRERPPEAQIRVRYYGEKPSGRSLIFEDCMYVVPIHPRGDLQSLTCVELARASEVPSFYETFRRLFARLWVHSQSEVSLEVAAPRAKQARVKESKAPQFVAVNLASE